MHYFHFYKLLIYEVNNKVGQTHHQYCYIYLRIYDYIKKKNSSQTKKRVVVSFSMLKKNLKVLGNLKYQKSVFILIFLMNIKHVGKFAAHVVRPFQ